MSLGISVRQGRDFQNRHSSTRPPLVLLLEGKPCPRQCPSVWNLCLLGFVFIVIISGRRLLLLISGRRLLLLIFFSLFELLTLRTLTGQQPCLFLRRFLSRWLRSWSLLRLLCLLVRRENLGKVLCPSSGHNGLWIFAPHTSSGRRRFFFGCLRGMQRGTTLAQVDPRWHRLHLSATFFMVLECSEDRQCSRRLRQEVVEQAARSQGRLNSTSW